MKKLLIISPYFPPVNTADMQRVRVSLPYFKDYGWEAEIVAVDAAYTDLAQDELLVGTIPADTRIHWVKAIGKKWTSKFGIGSISYRSYPFIKRKVNQLLAKQHFDLIYFSTTQFQVCTLGAYWRKKFKVPYVIDMQDPWHSEYYRDKPKHQQPPKHWLSYRLNKFLEPRAMKQAGGLISVSQQYIDTLKQRYPQLINIPSAVITFGAFEPDMTIAASNRSKFRMLLDPSTKNIVYIGRGGNDMHNALKPVFEALKTALAKDAELSKKLRFYFIGTSYAPGGQGEPTVFPLAAAYGVEEMVTELTDRVGYYRALNILQDADALFIPGSDDPAYTPSKIYPYLLTRKPLLAIFNAQSPALDVLNEVGVKNAYSYNETAELAAKVAVFLEEAIDGSLVADQYDPKAMEKYSAQTMTKRQCDLFNLVA